jgi:hypothetical protein
MPLTLDERRRFRIPTGVDFRSKAMDSWTYRHGGT